MSRNVSGNDICSYYDFDSHDVNSFPPSVIATWMTVITINSITALPTFYINLLVIWTIFESENLRSMISHFLLAVLSLTDLLVGLIVQPLCVTDHLCIIVQCSQLCNVHLAHLISSILCIGWSLCTLVIISVERYFYIEFPLYYVIFTAKKLKVATAISWVVMFVILFFGRVIKDSDTMRNLLTTLVPGLGTVIIVFCLTKVSLTARRQRMTINVQQAAFQQTNHSVQNRIKERKLTYTLGLIVLASALLYTPFVIIRIIISIKGRRVNADFSYISGSIAVTCLQFQSLVNPFILSFRFSRIRQGVIGKMRAHFAWMAP